MRKFKMIEAEGMELILEIGTTKGQEELYIDGDVVIEDDSITFKSGLGDIVIRRGKKGNVKVIANRLSKCYKFTLSHLSYISEVGNPIEIICFDTNVYVHNISKKGLAACFGFNVSKKYYHENSYQEDPFQEVMDAVVMDLENSTSHFEEV